MHPCAVLPRVNTLTFAGGLLLNSTLFTQLGNFLFAETSLRQHNICMFTKQGCTSVNAALRFGHVNGCVGDGVGFASPGLLDFNQHISAFNMLVTKQILSIMHGSERYFASQQLF